MTGGDIPPHRFLFHAYTYQYHLMEFSIILISTVRSAYIFSSGFLLKRSPQLEYVTMLEKERLKTRLWLPSGSLSNFLRWSIWEHNINLEREDDENPSSSSTLHIFISRSDLRCQISYRGKKGFTWTLA